MISDNVNGHGCPGEEASWHHEAASNLTRLTAVAAANLAWEVIVSDRAAPSDPAMGYASYFLRRAKLQTNP